MKAIVMTSAGAPDVLQLQEVPVPTLQNPTDLLVRLKAAGVNPIDTKIRQRGTFYPDRTPTILGCDGAGIVEAIGTGVEQFRVGDEVYFCQGGLGGPGGNYAEYAVVDERFVGRKPVSIDFVTAAATPLVLITAWEALYDRGRLEAGRSVLIHAGAGGVGHVAIQLAKITGATVYTTVSTPEKAALVERLIERLGASLGADRAILYRQTDFVQAILEATQGEGVDLAFDTVGGTVLSPTFAATAIYGDVVTILAPDAGTDWKTARDRNLRVSFELMLTPMLRGMVKAQQDQAKILQQGARLIEQGQMQIHVDRVFPLAEAASAHRLLESGSMTGKLVLEI